MVIEYKLKNCSLVELKELKSGMNIIFSTSKFYFFSCEEINKIIAGDEIVNK